ncbi:MAG: RelA/SpoT family protein [Prevotellaceae bacterium]|jgi:GTP pyrophosphokinase|nr:RelA/SpoT family protein [Prevotellaceae bacterium]
MAYLQTEEEIKLIQTHFDELLTHCQKFPAEEIEIIHRAFLLANDAHMGIPRKSGGPYIIHPIAVARIVAVEIGLGHKSIAAALLHDVVEDSHYTLDDIRLLFSDQIAYLVDGLTKIEGASDNNDSSNSKQAENFKKILITLSDDIRVILIKLADRLHNMRTLEFMAPAKQMKIASETMFIYAPLAHRMGFYIIKSELEDLSLKFSQPDAYKKISDKLKQRELDSKDFINRFIAPIIEELKQANITFEISSRFKSVYSTWRKMQVKDIPFEEVFDLFAIRIIFDATEGVPERIQCWHVYTLITEIYRSKIDRLRDWTSTPKANGYEALHCTVMGLGGDWVEVQIRTRRMDEIAERGIAAHWKYKDNEAKENELDRWLKQVKEFLENPNINALEFLDQFRMNLFANDISVFTPKGETKSLPKGATALDLAYLIHTEIGNHAIAAKVNHKLVSLNHVLGSGDQVEIVTTATQKPQLEWLNYVTTARAVSLIKNSLKSESKNNQLKGREIIECELQKFGIRPSTRTYRKLIEAYKVSDKKELFSNVGTGVIQLNNLDKILRHNTPYKWVQYWGMQILGMGSPKKNLRKKITLEYENEKNAKYKRIDRKTPYLLKENVEDKSLSYIIAECCKPIPGDEVVGFVNEDNVSVTIHKRKCPTATKLASQFGDRIVTAKWATHKVLSFLIVLEIKGIDRLGILNELTGIVTGQLGVNIRKLSVESHDGIFEGTIELYVHDTVDLNNLIMQVVKIKGIETVRRIEKIDSTVA